MSLRAQVGLGVGLGGGGGRGDRDRTEDSAIARTTTGETDETQDHREGHGRLAPRAEASVVVGLPLGKHLGLLAGSVVSATKNDGVDASVLAGLRYRF